MFVPVIVLKVAVIIQRRKTSCAHWYDKAIVEVCDVSARIAKAVNGK